METRRRREYEAEQHALGTTADGSLIILENLKELTDTGIEKKIAVNALKKANNDVQRALKLVTRLQSTSAATAELNAALASGEAMRLQQAVEAAERLKIPVTAARNRLDELLGNELVDEESLTKVLSIGVDRTAAQRALRAAKGNVEEAIKLCNAAPTLVEPSTSKGALTTPSCDEPSLEEALHNDKEGAENEEEQLLLNDLEKHEEVNFTNYPRCIVAGCDRMTWNCAENETCCRGCGHSSGRNHGPVCRQRHNEFCGARIQGKQHLEVYVKKRLQMVEYEELVRSALGGTLDSHSRNGIDELAGAELDQEEAILRQVYFDRS